MNLGVSTGTYRSRFGEVPGRPAKGETVATSHDLAVLDELLPHPTYAWAGWICVLSPSAGTFEGLKPLLDEAYGRAREGFERRTA